MTRAELLRALEAAGFPESSRAKLADEIAWIIEVHQAGGTVAPKPTEQFKQISAAAKKLHGLLDSLPESWRLSLGTVVSDKLEWGDPFDWRPTLATLEARADIMTGNPDGSAPKRGAPIDGEFRVLLLNLFELWERECPKVRPITRSDKEYSGPLLDLVADILTGHAIKFESRYALGRRLEKVIKDALAADLPHKGAGNKAH